MFKVNEFVRYGSFGIFQIKDIEVRKTKEGKKQTYYVMYSNDGVETKIITPIDNESLRPVMQSEEIEQLILSLPSLQDCWIEDKRLREEQFYKILKSGDMKQLAMLIRTLYLKKEEKATLGKQLAQKEQDILRQAENLLNEEVSLIAHIEKQEVVSYISEKLNSVS